MFVKSDFSKQLESDRVLYPNFNQIILENIFFPFIEANSGAVKRLGRSDAFATEFDLEAEEYVPLPKGDVHKRKEVIQDVTLHDLDVANARPQGTWQLISRNILTIEISRK